MVSNLANCTGIVDSEEGHLRLQREIDQLNRWAEEWQMEFNSDKWEML